MKSIMYAAVASLAFAAPVFAQSDHVRFAIMHFNMDADNASEMRMVPMGDAQVVDLNDNATLLEVFNHFNMDADSLSDVRGQAGVTVIMGDPSYAAEIFERLMEESRENE